MNKNNILSVRNTRRIILMLLGIMIYSVSVFAAYEESKATAVNKTTDQVKIICRKNGDYSDFTKSLPILFEKNSVQTVEEQWFEKASAICNAVAAGPDDELRKQGFSGILPEGTVLKHVSKSKTKNSIVVQLSFEREFLDKKIDELYYEILSNAFYMPVQKLGEKFSLSITANYKDEPSSPFKLLNEYVDRGAPPVKKEGKDDSAKAIGQPPAQGQGQPAGFLSGKTVFISAGHGWYYSSTTGTWITQRGNVYNNIEDISNAEAVDNWLLQYLWNAGANVWPTRERSMNTNMVIVDNTSSAFSTTGTWTTGTTVSGFYRTNYHFAACAATETATATFTPNIPAAGYYPVYIWYTPGANRAADAKITIKHTGGSTVWSQNMNQDSRTWKYIGTYYFDAGSNASKGAIVLSNQSSGTPGSTYVIADAIRVGGGMGDYIDGTTVSGKPRFEESGKYYSGFMGSTYDDGTVGAMPKYAAWENEPWEDAVYVSWHTNAYDGDSRGTISFAYSSGGWGGTFNGVTGGLELRNAIHNELINDIHAGWDASWNDQGTTTADFGEINPYNNSEMPASLHEMAFHDNAEDVKAIRDPGFRIICARAVYQGIAKYFAAKDGTTVKLLPEPPVNAAAKNNGSGGITLSWAAPEAGASGYYGDAPTGYKVYVSTDGKGFADGVAVTGTTYTVSSGLTEGTVYYFRISATNAGGESFPTELLSVRYKASGNNPILIVNGFDRLDRNIQIFVDDPNSSLDLSREKLDLMNNYSYVIPYADAIKAYNEYFDSCSNEAVINDAVTLGNYEAVIWILGNEATADETFSTAEQTRVQTYLTAGGKLFVSGSEIGYDIGRSGSSTAADIAFFNDYLKATYSGDDAGTYVAVGSAGIFMNLGSITFDNGTSIYNVGYPDQLGTNGGSTVNMTYSGGAGGNAGIQYSGTFKLVHLGFPFESITSSSKRQDMMNAILDFFSIGSAPAPTPTPILATPTPTETPTPIPTATPTPIPADTLIVEARDSSGTTLPSPALVETGTWGDSSAKSTAPGVSGQGSRYSECATVGTDTAVIVPNFPTAGTYEIFVTWGLSANAKNVKYSIKYNGGTTNVYKDQVPGSEGNANEWISLGQYLFNAGQNQTTGSITVDESEVTGPAGTYNTGRVYVDSFKLVKISTDVKDWQNYEKK